MVGEGDWLSPLIGTTILLEIFVVYVGFSTLKKSFSSIKEIGKDGGESHGRKSVAIINTALGLSFLILFVWVIMDFASRAGYLIFGSIVIVIAKSAMSLVISSREGRGTSERLLPWSVVIIGVGVIVSYAFFLLNP